MRGALDEGAQIRGGSFGKKWAKAGVNEYEVAQGGGAGVGVGRCMRGLVGDGALRSGQEMVGCGRYVR